MSIAQKIGENKIEKNNPFRVTDIIHATIKIQKPEQIMGIISVLDQNSSMMIVKIDNQLDQEIKRVKINVIFQQSVIGEIEIRLGNEPV